MNRLKSDFKFYSMPRSGTTLLRLIINSIFEKDDGDDIDGGHMIPSDGVPVLCNVRDFRDVVASLWRIRHAKYDSNGKATSKMSFTYLPRTCNTVKARIEILDSIKRRTAPKFFVKYESYWDNHDLLIDWLGQFLHVEIPDELRAVAKINARFSDCKDMSKSIGYDFDKYDENTGIHGGHIYTGKPGTWRDLIENRSHDAVSLYFHDELERWGYDPM